MKRLFKKILIPTIVTTAILPITCCSKNEIIETGSIEIVSNVEDITVLQNEQHLSAPIEVRCISYDKKELSYQFKLKLKNNQDTPDWISINDKNQIELKTEKEVGKYDFTLVAYNLENQLYSETKTFSVNVINERHIVPDELYMSMQDDWYYMYGESSTPEISITPYKEGVEEKYLLNDVKCSVNIVYGPKTTDLLGYDLFTCQDGENGHNLVISSLTDSSYCGQYLLSVTATLVADSSIYVTKLIVLHIANVYSYEDSSSKCTFTRTKDDEGWTVTSMNNNGNILYNLPSEIYHWPVVKIAENFCQNSQIDSMVQIILPSSIKTIGANAFVNQTALASIEIPGVKYVGNCAFKNDSLAEFRIKSELPKIVFAGDEAFYNCKQLKTPSFSDLNWAGKNAFFNTAFSSVEIGENCLFLGSNSFSNNTSLNSFRIWTQKPPLIGGSLLDQCDNLKSIQVPIESLIDYKTDESWKNLGKNIEGI